MPNDQGLEDSQNHMRVFFWKKPDVFQICLDSSSCIRYHEKFGLYFFYRKYYGSYFILSERGNNMWLLAISIITNIILSVTLFFVNRRSKIKREKVAVVERITDRLLKKQIEILQRGDYTTNSIELEISKYVKDVLVKSLITGEFKEFKKKLLPQMVQSECPDISEEEYIEH